EDGKGRKLEEGAFTAEGRPTLYAGGTHHRWVYRLDARGNVLESAAYDVEGRPTVFRKDGHHRWTARYDEGNRQTEQDAFGLDGKPANGLNGSARIRNRYDAQGNLEEAAYWMADPEGNFHLWKRLDGKGRLLEWVYLTPQGLPTVSQEGGHHRTTRRSDER